MSRWFAILVLACSTAAYAAPDSLSATHQEPTAWTAQLRDHWASLSHGVVYQAHDVADHTTNLVATAMGFLGVPYRRGGNSAETGFDCSGFVRSMFEQTRGLLLPRRAAEQAAHTAKIDKKDLQPGDLVFFNTMRHAFSHVGIYIGDGKFIHSPRSGEQVRVEDMGTRYWRLRFNGARRVADQALGGDALRADTAIR